MGNIETKNSPLFHEKYLDGQKMMEQKNVDISSKTRFLSLVPTCSPLDTIKSVDIKEEREIKTHIHIYNNNRQQRGKRGQNSNQQNKTDFDFTCSLCGQEDDICIEIPATKKRACMKCWQDKILGVKK